LMLLDDSPEQDCFRYPRLSIFDVSFVEHLVRSWCYGPMIKW
jgi:hypothetical protein